jgi:AcrR family transcriptional regulator
MEAALVLAARSSTSQTSIDEMLEAADVSRATFYKYYDSVPAVMGELAAEVAGELGLLLDPLVQQFPDPAVRLSCGVRLSLRFAGHHNAIGRLILRGGWPNVDKSHHIFRVMHRDIAQGIREGRFAQVSETVALNLVTGSLVGGIHSMLEGTDRDYPEQAALCVLRGLGVDLAEATKIATMTLPDSPIPGGGVVARMLGHGIARDRS